MDVDDPPEEILAYVREQRHSRLPVYADSVDNVIGILQIRKYIKACIKAGGKAVDIRPLLDEPVFVHQSTLIAEVLPELSRRKANLAIVTDNYGGTLGIVTVEDIVEELVGEINDVFYHMMVMMNECGVTMEDVCKEMDIRAQKIGNLKKFHVSDHNT